VGFSTRRARFTIHLPPATIHLPPATHHVKIP